MSQLGLSPTPTSTVSPYAPCPNCRSTNATPVGFSWWGGIVGPKILHHVKCSGCGCKYNGKTGQSNTVAITVYIVVVSIVLLALFYALGM